jgi:hypothetical protein
VKNERRSRFNGQVDFVTCWPENSPLPFVSGCDLEVLLIHYVEPDVMFEAIKCTYADAGHPLEEQNWIDACDLIQDAVSSQ